MSRKDALLLASRGLALLFTIAALVEVSYLPEFLTSLLHYKDSLGSYWRTYYIFRTGFLFVRIVGYSLAAKWLFKGGPEVDELLIPASQDRVEG
jgi:hypothetical protein